MLNVQKQILYAVALLAAFYCCFANYQWNSFGIATGELFERNLIDSESAVVAGILESRKNGLTSQQLRLGWYKSSDGKTIPWSTPGWVQFQFDALKRNESGVEYVPYASQPGAARWFHTGLELVFGRQDIELHRAIVAGLMSVLVITFGVWTFHVFGPIPGVLVVFTFFFSQWIIIFARNIYWQLWIMFLPMVLVSILCTKKRVRFLCLIPNSVFFSTLFCVLLFRFCAGFEYVSTLMIATIVPIFLTGDYLSAAGRKAGVKMAGVVSLICLLAFFAALLVWFIQSYIAFGSMDVAVKAMATAVAKRVHAAPGLDIDRVYLESLEKPIFDILHIYARGYWAPSFSYWASGLIFVVSVAVGGLLAKSRLEYRNDIIRCLVASLVALLAPISWFVLARGHSAIHTHMNFMLWSLPTLPIVALFCGVVLERTVKVLVVSREGRR